MKDKPAVQTNYHYVIDGSYHFTSIEMMINYIGNVNKEIFRLESFLVALKNSVGKLDSDKRVKELESLLESKATYVCDEHLVKRIKELEEDVSDKQILLDAYKFVIKENMIAYAEEMLKKDKEIQELKRELILKRVLQEENELLRREMEEKCRQAFNDSRSMLDEDFHIHSWEDFEEWKQKNLK